MVNILSTSYILTLLMLCLISGATFAQTDQQRKLFRNLYFKALQGKHQQVMQRRKPLAGYAIEHYLDYALLRSDMDKLPEQAVADFKLKYPTSPLNRQLKNHLLDQLGQQRKWPQYLQHHNGIDQGKRQCWYLRARINQQKTTGIAPLIEAMWLTGLSAPDACNPAFKWWEDQGHMTEDLLVKRIKLTFESHNFTLAGHLKKKLTSPPAWIDQAIELMQNPESALLDSTQWAQSKELPQLIHKTSMRLAKRKPATLFNMWPTIKAAHQLKPSQFNQIERQMALFAATDYEPFSITAMQQLPAAMKDDQINAWIVRYHLYQQQWPEVLNALQQMPLRQLGQDRWQYWTARSLAKTGDIQRAKQIFQVLSKKTNYYGFLAADHLRLPYGLCNKPANLTLTQFQAPAAITRAIELHHAGLLTMARREWNTAYKSLSREEKIALAELVNQQQWYAKSIAIMADLGLWENYNWRYPQAHQQTILSQANTSNPMPQWVMAIIKQESAWTKDAVSHANAHGLMQLLPSTASAIAKQLAIPFKHANELHQAAFNIQLGVQYQKNLFKQFDHPILVAAAYNAGEGKSNDWSTGFPNSPDIWLETIPYRETRDYVTRILSNVTIYDWLINQTPRRISSWMPTIPIDQKPSKLWPNKTVPQQTTQVVCNP